MTPCFADTHYWLAILNSDDQDHDRVVDVTRGLNRPIVTTTWVLTEVGDAMAAPRQRPAFVNLLDELAADASVIVTPAAQSLFDRGTTRFRERPDKAWSLTDCISFVVMEERGLLDALTADHHFEQAGFIALLK